MCLGKGDNWQLAVSPEHCDSVLLAMMMSVVKTASPLHTNKALHYSIELFSHKYTVQCMYGDGSNCRKNYLSKKMLRVGTTGPMCTSVPASTTKST